MSSAASSGGAAGASGVDFQDQVFGWAAAAMVAERPTLVPVVVGTVVRVGAQTGFAMDDVAVLTDAENYALFQAKVGLNLGKAEDSALGEALGQAVAQYLDGRVRQSTGSHRPVDPSRDALILCTDTSAPATVREHLAKAVTRTGSQPPGTPLGQDLTTKQLDAFKVALTHVRRLWADTGRAAPGEEELRQFFRALRVLVLDLDTGRGDHQAAVSSLATALPVAHDAASAYSVLVAEGLAASVAREWRGRDEVGLALAHAGVRISPPVRYEADIDILLEHSATVLQTLQSDAELPVPGGLHIHRAVAAELIAVADRDNLLIVGDAGVGKSSVTQDFATTRRGAEEVVVLRASDIAGINRLPLSAPLATILRSWVGPPSTIVIDGVDALRGSADRDVLTNTVDALKNSRWQVVATVRTFDVRNNQPLQRAFRGAPIASEDRGRGRLNNVRHLFVGELTDGELEQAIRPPLMLATVLAHAPAELRALLRNPFNLRLAAELADGLPTGERTRLLAVRSRVELLAAYWDWRVRNQDQSARDEFVSHLCRAMVTQRSIQVTQAEPVVRAEHSTALEALLSQGVLRSEDGVVTGARRVLSFSHNILFDYATALYVLYDPTNPSGLVDELDTDPPLPLIARPSVEILVDLLWEHRAMFWRVCLDVAASPHVLASLAFAFRMLNLIRTPSDLEPLAPSPEVTDALGLTPVQILTGQLMGALRAPTVLPDASAAIVPLAALTRRLAENSGYSHSDGALAVDMMTALHLRAPVTPTSLDREDRCRAVVALLDGCRSNPHQMENLARATTRQLAYMIGGSIEIRDAVERLLDDEAALTQWGGSVLYGIAECIAPTVPNAPALARRMAATVLTFQETREEQVMLVGSSIIGLKESRRQQAEFGAYILAEAFGEICAANLQVGAQIYCDLANNGIHASDPHEWPLSITEISGWLADGPDMTSTRLECGVTAAAALATALAEADAQQAKPAVDVLVAQLHNAAAWAAILTPAADPTALGRTLLPVLESGALLLHPDTHPPAARLLAALGDDESVPADKLEAAVVHAVALTDQNGRQDDIEDVLIGCLRPDRITDPDLAAKRSALGADPPEIRERITVFERSGRSSIVDALSESGAIPVPTVEAAARNLEEKVNRAWESDGSGPEHHSELADAFLAADEAFAQLDDVPERLQLMLVDAAAALTRDEHITPGTPVGDRTLAVLIAGSTSTNAGSF